MAIKGQSGSTSGGVSGDKRMDFRSITPADIEAKGKKGKSWLYKVMDSNNKWYTVWGDENAERGVIAVIDKANDAGEEVFCAVEISKDGKYTNYTIRAVGDEARQMQATLPLDQPQAQRGGGGGGGYSPEDIKRMTNLALMKMATQLAAAASDSKDKEVQIKQQVMLAEQFTFLKDFFEGSLKPTAGKASSDGPPPLTDDDVPADEADDDIPF